ncbi:MAG TPA: hypothetical protein VHZ76_03175 [Gammaproteobacteria bacterium]|jgi:hypothetical protein|nr:hypothetical protein [Gammaproteobacteria bacterium]
MLAEQSRGQTTSFSTIRPFENQEQTDAELDKEIERLNGLPREELTPQQYLFLATAYHKKSIISSEEDPSRHNSLHSVMAIYHYRALNTLDAWNKLYALAYHYFCLSKEEKVYTCELSYMAGEVIEHLESSWGNVAEEENRKYQQLILDHTLTLKETNNIKAVNNDQYNIVRAAAHGYMPAIQYLDKLNINKLDQALPPADVEKASNVKDLVGVKLIMTQMLMLHHLILEHFIYHPNSNLIPCASGSALLQLIVLVCRRI